MIVCIAVFSEHQQKPVVPTEIQSMDKCQRSHSLDQQHQQKAEMQVDRVGHKEIYPSISEETLNKAINFAENHTSISQENIRIIKHSRKSLLFYNKEPWKKKEHGSSFGVTMGSFDDAELRELIGIYIESLLESFLENDQMGLLRDDGLIILCNINNQQTGKYEKSS